MHECVHSHMMAFNLATPRCTLESGMSDPQKIPETGRNTPSGSTGDIGDPDNPLVVPPNTPDITIDLPLGGTDTYPNPPNVVDRVEVRKAENVKSFQVWYKPPGSNTYVFVDNDNDGVPDVRSSIVNVPYITRVLFQAKRA